MEPVAAAAPVLQLMNQTNGELEFRYKVGLHIGPDARSVQPAQRLTGRPADVCHDAHHRAEGMRRRAASRSSRRMRMGRRPHW